MLMQNAALRRKNSTYRRQTNTCAKTDSGLQMTLDIQWIIHNFVNVHFTTKKIPAIAPGIIDKGLSLPEVFKIPMVALNQ